MVEKNKHIPENFSYFNLEISIIIYIFLEHKFNTLTEDEEHWKVGLENFLEMKNTCSLNHNGIGYILMTFTITLASNKW